MCGTVVLDVKLDTLQHRVANSIYESARSGQLELQGFPDFTPVVTSLRDKADETGPASYKVCVQKHANLCVLQSLAKQWLESDMFRPSLIFSSFFAQRTCARHDAGSIDGRFLGSKLHFTSRRPSICRKGTVQGDPCGFN